MQHDSKDEETKERKLEHDIEIHKKQVPSIPSFLLIAQLVLHPWFWIYIWILRNETKTETYLFKEIKVNTVSLLFSDKEISLLESSRDSGNVHGGRGGRGGFSHYWICKGTKVGYCGRLLSADPPNEIGARTCRWSFDILLFVRVDEINHSKYRGYGTRKWPLTLKIVNSFPS